MSTEAEATRRCREADILTREEFGARFGRRFDDLLPDRIIQMVAASEALHAREGRACPWTKETRAILVKRKAAQDARRRSIRESIDEQKALH